MPSSISQTRVYIFISGFPCINLKCYLINMRLRKVEIYNALSEDQNVLTLEMDTCLTRKENPGVSPTQKQRVRGGKEGPGRMEAFTATQEYPQDSIPAQSQH